jgi:hypothetical protein
MYNSYDSIPILMHQMRISTTCVSSVMLRPKKLEIRNVMTVKIPKQTQKECREMESNPSKDRSMHDGNNPRVRRILRIEVTFFMTARLRLGILHKVIRDNAIFSPFVFVSEPSFLNSAKCGQFANNSSSVPSRFCRSVMYMIVNIFTPIMIFLYDNFTYK